MSLYLNKHNNASEDVENLEEDNTNLINKLKSVQLKVKQLQARNLKQINLYKQKSLNENTKEEQEEQKQKSVARVQKLGMGKTKRINNIENVFNSDNKDKDIANQQVQMVQAQQPSGQLMCATPRFHAVHKPQQQVAMVKLQSVYQPQNQEQFQIKQQDYNPMDSIVQEDISLHCENSDLIQDEQSYQINNSQTNESISQNNILKIQQGQQIKQLGVQKDDQKFKVNTLTGTSISSNQQQMSISTDQETNILSDEVFEGENIAQFVLNLETVSQRWGAQERRKFEIAISCLGVAKVSKVDIIQQYAKANQPRERYIVHRQQYLKQLVKDWNLANNQQIKNYMYDRQSPNKEILSKICKYWEDPQFIGFSNDQINDFLHE